ncbi:receptor-type tyrosine-protein phosphatase F-like isoform X2 [Acropora palmata]|uniref:receptor-type tyrosine-protein phosphatase F-like isoform X2 n=1 Tax=Acropora palmata TaxID=6131 RepID=UPI003DA0B909
MGEIFAKRIDHLSNLRRWFPILLLVTLCPFGEEVVPEVTIEGAPEEDAVVGNEIQLTCHYDSSPVASEVQWLKNGKVISRDDTMENNTRGNITHFNETSIQLTISPSISSDAANYTCFVIKDVDKSSDTIAIRVKPDPPHNLLISSTTSRTLTVSWSAGFNGNSEIISYKVNISQDNQTLEDISCQESSNNNLCTVPGVVTNVTLKDLHPFTMYYLRVFAVNKIGQSEASEVVKATTGEEVPSAPPSNVTGRSKSSTSIFVQWDQVPAADQNVVILNYTIKYTETDSSGSEAIAEKTVVVVAPKRNVTLENLNEYKIYKITVAASTSKGKGRESEPPLQIRTEQDKPKAPPSNVTGHSPSSTSIFVQWDQVPTEDQNGVIQSYTVIYKMLEVCPGLVTRNKTTSDNNFTLTGLNKYTNYSITVFASTVKGNGIVSPATIIRTDQDVPSNFPDGLKLNDTTSTSILVQWDKVPYCDKNGIITSYTVRYQAINDRTNHGNKTIVLAPLMSANLTDLIINMKYRISVLASTVKGDGPYSSSKVFTTNQSEPGAAPRNVRGNSSRSTTILVWWDEVPVSKQHDEIISYTVFYWKTDGGSQGKEEKEETKNRKVKLIGLQKYTNYTIQVLASTIKGDGPRSDPTIVRTDQDTPDGSPVITGLTALDSTTVMVEWRPVPENLRNGIITRYIISYKDEENEKTEYKSIPAPALEAIITGLRQRVRYSFKIRAATSKGEGPFSGANVTETEVVLMLSKEAERGKVWTNSIYRFVLLMFFFVGLCLFAFFLDQA